MSVSNYYITNYPINRFQKAEIKLCFHFIKKIINDRLQMPVFNFTLKFAIENENRGLVFFSSIIAYMVKYIVFTSSEIFYL